MHMVGKLYCLEIQCDCLSSRRVSYVLVIASHLTAIHPVQGSASWAAMGTVVRTPAGALLATVVGSLGTACSDVVVDSIVVERSRNAPQVSSHWC